MNINELRKSLPAHVGGIFIAARDLIRQIDGCSSIEFLRGTQATQIFREQIETFEAWVRAAAAAQGKPLSIDELDPAKCTDNDLDEAARRG